MCGPLILKLNYLKMRSMNIKISNVVLISFFIIMVTATIHTSLQSNLFVVFPDLVKIPWFNATLIDFYLNQLMLYGILIHLEKYKFVKTLPWFVAMICLGSMATSVYLVYYLNFKKREKSND